MEAIKNHIKLDLFELNPSQRTDAMTLEFAQWLKKNDSHEYQDIMEEIDFDDLHDSIVDSDDKFINVQFNMARNLIINAFDAFIDDLREEIGLEIECEDEESDFERRQEWERSELKSMNRGGV